ncbi:SLBB domain-containing protein [Salisaeta longa]|uniref:SLBB domain-containing protein n=1 Tax=Salisaeta longa TaxID=503170 RepID=UPI0003B4FA7E|nr:SLBB domain-containing protein [Salisaeta longa]
MVQRLIALLVLGWAGFFMAGNVQAQQQPVPEAVQDELERRGMTVQEARQRAQALGIDLSNPQQAIRRARQLGIPEARIQALLQAVRQSQAASGAAGTSGAAITTPPQPTLTDRPTITPDSLSVTRLPQTVQVEVSLRSDSIMQRVQPFFLTPAGDTANVRRVQRIEGSVLRGTWQGELRIPRDSMAGTWTLFVRAATRDTTVSLLTGSRLVLLPEDFERDEDRRATRDSLQYFGYDVFNTIPQAFQPSPTGPVDDSYVVGPNDELRLTVWGGAEFQYDLQVDRQGRITIPSVGQYTVAGKSLADLRTDLRQWLGRYYSGLVSDPPTVFMDLMVTRVRPIQVYVLGAVPQPGGYTVSSYATVFNALYSVGGPLTSGSLRNIQVVRNGDVVDTVDLYGYLVGARAPNPVHLQGGDYIFVPPRGETVSIRGEVQRPAIYEVKPEETVSDLLQFAGGLTPEAYAQRFQISRIVPFAERDSTGIARTVLDRSLAAVRSDTAQVPLADGDEVRILSIRPDSDRVARANIPKVEVTGAVYQPGTYALGSGLRTVRDLVQRADGLTGDAYKPRAQLYRIGPNLDFQVTRLDLRAVMDDVPTANVVLRPGDSLHVASVQAMRQERTVRISGKVRNPGTYAYRDSMTVGDLLFMAGGLYDRQFLKEVFLGRADLYREMPDGKTKRIIPFDLARALRGGGFATRNLLPDDEIRIYADSLQELKDRFVRISGAVKAPGRYTYYDNMTLKDIIVQARGFTEGASLRSIEVTRMVRDNDVKRRARTIIVPLNMPGATSQNVSFSVGDTTRAMRSADTFVLEHRDRVFVRTSPSFQPQRTVVVRGEVTYPGEYTLLRSDETLASVIQRAGGILPTGYPKGGRLRRNGEQVIVEIGRAIARKGDANLSLQAGDEIIIPPQPNTVAVRGNVANEGLIKHNPGKRVEYYLDRAGGAQDDTKTILLTQANGATFRIQTGWFRVTPEVDDGATIRVIAKEPEPENQDDVDVGQVIQQTTAVLSSALTIIVLATRAFN